MDGRSRREFSSRNMRSAATAQASSDRASLLLSRGHTPCGQPLRCQLRITAAVQ